MDWPSIWGPAGQAGQAGRDEGFERVERHAEDEPWRALADLWLRGLPRGARLTSDTLADAVGQPAHRNAIGARFGDWSRKGLIRAIGRTKTSHAQAHARWILVWEKQ